MVSCWKRRERVRIVLVMAVGRFNGDDPVSPLLPLLLFESLVAWMCVEMRAGAIAMGRLSVFSTKEGDGAKLCTEHEFWWNAMKTTVVNE